jgi:acrylyl-CoA reductase (NADPH)
MNALILESQNGRIVPIVRPVPEVEWPAGEVTVRVAFSSINYKDALAVTNRGKIVRAPYPFVPGIDFAGTVTASSDARYASGDAVIGTGWGIGEDRWGGYAEQVHVEASQLVPLPAEMTLRDAMVAGTAGFTAMLSVMAIEEHGIRPVSGEIAVTGATGGVGSFAVRILAGLGYRVVASTGKRDAEPYLRALGAARIIPRNDLGDGPKRPLDTARWAGAVDTLGGPALAALISQTGRHGSIAACGLAASPELSTTVFPFILRGITLVGIDSNTCPFERRLVAWRRLATLPASETFDRHVRMVTLEEIPAACEALMRGEVTGRVVVDLNR